MIVTTYHASVPAYVAISEEAKAAGQIMWGGKQTPPVIGSTVRINFNGLGSGTVQGYFVEHCYLGVVVKLANAPEWHRKQNHGNPEAHVFGVEIVY